MYAKRDIVKIMSYVLMKFLSENNELKISWDGNFKPWNVYIIY